MQLEELKLFRSKTREGGWSDLQQQRHSFATRVANWALDDGAGDRLPVVQSEKADSISLQPAGMPHTVLSQCTSSIDIVDRLLRQSDLTITGTCVTPAPVIINHLQCFATQGSESRCCQQAYAVHADASAAWVSRAAVAAWVSRDPERW